MNRFFSMIVQFSLALALVPGPASAGPGHDHDHGEKTSAMNLAPASPRFEAHSDLFEVVGVLDDKELSIFVDDFASNAAVNNAKLELESGKTRATGQFHDEHGDYSFDAAPFKKPGSYPISLTITTDDTVDILAGNLIVPDAHAPHDNEESSALIKRPALWALGLAIFIALLWGAKRLQNHRRAEGVQ